VQQLLAMYGVTSSATVFVLLSAAITAVVATASWFGVERPLMHRWKRATP